MSESWQEQLRQAVHSVEELQDYAFLQNRSLEAEQKYRVLVPQYYLGLIDRKDPNDPIARMAFAHQGELDQAGLRDPIGDLDKQAAPRLTHRYRDRALLHVTNLCPMYCRFCFRKNLMNEKEANLYKGEFVEALQYVKAHKEIKELILTGGDPWMLTSQKLSNLVDEISSLFNVHRLRFHTRMPVTLPSRVNEKLIMAIHRPERFQTVVVTHFNHPKELSRESRAAITMLKSAGISVLNQTVLLAGVNDSAETLITLFEALGDAGAMPYYLHQCDLVRGGNHFRVPLGRGRELWQSLRGKLPGYLIPEYVLDLPGGLGKIPVGGARVDTLANGDFRIHAEDRHYDYSEQQI